MGALEPGDFSHTNSKREKKRKRKRKIPGWREGAGWMGGEGHSAAEDQRQPRRPHFANCLQRGVTSSPCSEAKHSARLAWARIINTPRWAIRCTESSHLPLPQKGQNFGQLGVGVTAPTQTYPSVRAGEGTWRPSDGFRISCFFFQALPCKVRRLHAKLERCRKAEGGGVRVGREGCLTPATQASM